MVFIYMFATIDLKGENQFYELIAVNRVINIIIGLHIHEYASNKLSRQWICKV